ncbi:gamma-aminobutyric acid type B receptor subunit 2-like [Amphiura filiformis]|uniref:gamma-aminobutyric acid type B receptor subunit 2-like n=1 Tax=Amphiura filiformis TaxID=82378 RepID=UPI003B21D604
MFSKTWRVYRVAALKTPKRRVITDNHLFIMVFVFFCIDVSVLTLWQLIDPLHIEAIDLYERETEILNQQIIPYIEQCTSNKMIYWLVALYGYKGLLLIFGTFLAWETRKVTISALNDSKLIGICVYNTVVLCIVGVSVSFLISNDTAALYIFTSCIIIFCATLTLAVLFVPKVVSVYKFPAGEPTVSTVVSGNSMTPSIPNNGVRSIDQSFDDDNKKLRDKISELENKLGAYKSSVKSEKEAIHNGGCGIWCCSMVCGCRSSISADEDIGNTDNEEHGIVNQVARISETNVV